jgi:glycosyltransferase involved in cell wall biosynthesis
MSYPACAHGAIWFCRKVLPYLSISGVETWLVGRDPTPEVQALANEYTHVTGWVDDVMPYYDQAKICIVPLWAGGGTRLKILEAMALGRPVVSTSIGCEGLEVVDGKHLFIADDAIEFAEKVTRLLEDPSLRQQMITNARALVVAHYDWTVLTNQLVDIYQEAISEKESNL